MSKTKLVRLTEEQMAALRKLAETDETAKAVITRADAPKRQGGVAKEIMAAVFKNPAMTAAEVKAAFPKVAEKRAAYLHKEALKLVALLKSLGRWREESEKPVKKAA